MDKKICFKDRIEAIIKKLTEKGFNKIDITVDGVRVDMWEGFDSPNFNVSYRGVFIDVDGYSLSDHNEIVTEEVLNMMMDKAEEITNF